MQEVEKKYKSQLTAELREEYGITNMVPFDNPMQATPAASSNTGFSGIKTEPLDVNDLANSMKKSGATKRHFDGIAANTPPKKKIASAAEFKDLMTPKKQTKTSLKSKFASPKPTSQSKDKEDPTFEISNQEYLHSITNVKVDKMKTAHGLRPTKDFTLKLWHGLEKCNSTLDRDSLEGFLQFESDSFSCIMIRYFPELQSSEESEICCAEKLRHILAHFAAVNCVSFTEVNIFFIVLHFCTTQMKMSGILCWIHGPNMC